MLPALRHLLVVDDDAELCQLLSEYLVPEGYDVESVHSGVEGVERALSGDHALVVLDVMLPDVRGFEVLRQLRAQSRMPVLMLTARGNEQDRILGLEMGADDYLPKPFNPRELCARIEAILRRSGVDRPALDARASGELAVDDVSMNKGSRIVRRGRDTIELTTVEFDLLEALLRAAGRVIPRDELVRSVLNRPFSPFDRSIDTHVSNLRRKLGPTLEGHERIKSVRGIGYQYTLRHPLGALEK
ncbi:MAG TPA: response regulator transcription factor [Vicinamibacterales bacterium]|jgi:two-component system response regulator CpxR|nr:response regulator transcription factor [Vicinamibacterales bacterium]